MCCERTLVPLFHRPASQRSRVLCYHSVGTPAWGVNDVGPGRFRRQLEAALHLGYHFVPAEVLAREPGEGRLAITFDDGLTSVATNAAPLLADLGIPWSLYVVADWSDGRHRFGDGTILGWREIERLASSGATIGSHSLTHPNFGLLSKAAAEEELFRSREVIAARLGITPASFAIPFGQSGNWSDTAAKAAASAGYRMVFAQSETRRPADTVPRTFITRFDSDRVFRAALGGSFDSWEEWL